MLTFPEVLMFAKEFMVPLLTTAFGGGIASISGLIPRAGPGRAAWIALRSRFAFKPVPESLRTEEVKALKEKLAIKNSEQSYLVITGEKGVGKSCLIATATSKTPGVINIEVAPGTKTDDIVKSALQALTKSNLFPPFASAKRVVFWHRLFTFGRSPIIVMNALERKIGHEYADMAGAVRTLVDNYKLRVIVDSSPNSLDETVLRTKRETVLNVKPMTRAMIWKLGQFHDLFKYIKEAGLDDVVFAVLGGNPADYGKLWRETQAALMNGQNAREVIGNYLCSVIYSAIDLFSDSSVEKEIIKLFDKKNNYIPVELLTANGLVRPTPDKIFRKVKKNRARILIPASNAVGIVLRHKLVIEPTLEELEELIKSENHGFDN